MRHQFVVWAPVGLILSVAFLHPGLAFSSGAPDLGAEAKQIFSRQRPMKAGGTKACTDCHNPNSDDGTDAFNDILNIENLRTNGILSKEDPSKSPLYKALIRKTAFMPRGGAAPISSEELETLLKWMAAGSPAAQAPDDTSHKAGFISTSDDNAVMTADLRGLAPEKQPFTRYLTFTHLYNAGLVNALENGRQALTKLLNSLSWNPTVSQPVALGLQRTIYRIDLRDYGWTSDLWEQVASTNPYAVPLGSYDTTTLRETGTSQPFLRGDWFIDVASKPPLYYSILDIPDTDLALEQKLHFDVSQDIANQIVIRAGFRQSGVSVNNRMIERHVTDYGYYWKSYDFATSSGNQNLYAHPLDFQKNGGEIIFSLPNGLQAYMLINADGKRLNEGPINIVQDKKRVRDGFTVLNGQSCFGCHVAGMIRHDDEIRSYVGANASLFDPSIGGLVPLLYADTTRLNQAFEEDERRYQVAIEHTGNALPSDTVDQIFKTAYEFEGNVSMPLAASEIGMTPASFIAALTQHPELQVQLGFNAAGGVIDRKTFLGLFGELAKELNPPSAPDPGEGPPTIETLEQGGYIGVSEDTCGASAELRVMKSDQRWSLTLTSSGAPEAGCEAFVRRYDCERGTIVCSSSDTSLTQLKILSGDRLVWGNSDGSGAIFEYRFKGPSKIPVSNHDGR